MVSARSGSGRRRGQRSRGSEVQTVSHFDVAAIGSICRDFPSRLRACQKQILDSTFWPSLVTAIESVIAEISSSPSAPSTAASSSLTTTPSSSSNSLSSTSTSSSTSSTPSSTSTSTSTSSSSSPAASQSSETVSQQWRAAEIVCYGIGPFGESPRAQYQLVCLLLLALRMEVRRVLIFDPVLSAEEVSELDHCLGYLDRASSSLSIEVLSQDEQGRRKATEPTLFFMPHCNRELYENLVAVNVAEASLHECVVIGNSFRVYHEQVVSREARRALQMVLASYESGLVLQNVEQFQPYFEAFNDTAVHGWTRQQCQRFQETV